MKKFLKKMGKKGIFGNLSNAMIGLGSFFIVVLVIILIIAEAGDTSIVTNDGNATAAVSDMQEAANIAPQFSPVIVIAVLGFSLIALFGGLAVAGRRN